MYCNTANFSWGKKDAVTKMSEQFFTVYPWMLEVFGKARSVQDLSTRLICRGHTMGQIQMYL